MSFRAENGLAHGAGWFYAPLTGVRSAEYIDSGEIVADHGYKALENLPRRDSCNCCWATAALSSRVSQLAQRSCKLKPLGINIVVSNDDFIVAACGEEWQIANIAAHRRFCAGIALTVDLRH